MSKCTSRIRRLRRGCAIAEADAALDAQPDDEIENDEEEAVGKHTNFDSLPSLALSRRPALIINDSCWDHHELVGVH